MSTNSRVRILTALVDTHERELHTFLPTGFTGRQFNDLLDVAWQMETEGLVSVWIWILDGDDPKDPDARYTTVVTASGHRPVASYGGAA